MKYKLCTFAVITVLLLILCTLPAMASNISVSATVDIDSKCNVVITGNYDCPSYFKDQQRDLMLLVVYTDSPKYNPDAFANTDFLGVSMDGVVKMAMQIKPDSNGDFSYSYMMFGFTGNYEFRLIDYYGNTLKIEKVMTVVLNELFGSIKTVHDDELMETFLTSFQSDISFNSTGYELLNKTSKQEILQQVFNFSDVTSMADLQSKVKALPILEKLFLITADPAVIIDYIGKSAAKEGVFNSDAGKLFLNGLNATMQNTVVTSYLGNNSFTAELFRENTAMAYLANAKDYSQLLLVVDEYPNAIGYNATDMATYKRLSNKTIVIQNVFSALPVNKTSEFSTLFSTYVKQQAEKERDTGGNSHSPKRGGNGSPISVNPPIITPLVQQPEIGTTGHNGSTVINFQDLSDVLWAKTAIDALAAKQVINGESSEEFCPNNMVTREEFVKMLTGGLRLSGVEAIVNFTDVKETDWFYRPVAAAYRAGIVSGYEDNSFGVGQPLSRQDMAVMIERAMKNKGIKLTETDAVAFSDQDDIAKYAQKAVALLASAGVLSGMDDESFMPQRNLTRAEATVALYKFLKVANGGEYI